MGNSYTALIWSFWVVSTICYGLLTFTTYKKIHRRNFRFQQQLPFELHEVLHHRQSRFSVYAYLILLMGISLLAYWQAIWIQTFSPVTYILFIFMVFFIITMLMLFLYQPQKIEVYIFIVSLFYVSAIAMMFLGSYLAFIHPLEQWHSFLPWTTLSQAILQLILVLNPRLKQWAQLEKVESANEKPLYQRPTQFVMAYTQWLTMLNVILWVITTQFELII